MEVYIDYTFWSHLSSNPFTAVWQIFTGGGWVVAVIFFVLLSMRLWLFWRRSVYAKKAKFRVIAIDIPTDIEPSGPKRVENIFAQLSSAPRTGNLWETWWQGFHPLPASFEVVGIDGFIQFIVRADESLIKLIETSIYAQYSSVEFTEIDDYATRISMGDLDNGVYDIWGAEYVLEQKLHFPIRTYPYFEHIFAKQFADPLTAVFETMNDLKSGEQLWFQIGILPADPSWQAQGVQKIQEIIGEGGKKMGILGRLVGVVAGEAKQILSETGKQSLGTEIPVLNSGANVALGQANFQGMLTPDKEPLVAAIQSKISRPGVSARVRIVYAAKTEVFSQARAYAEFQGILKQFDNKPFNVFVIDKGYCTAVNYFKKLREPAKKRALLERAVHRAFCASDRSGILNAEELATIWHFPMNMVQKVHDIADVGTKKVKASHRVPRIGAVAVNAGDITVIGQTNFRNEKIQFGIRNADRRRHIYLIGKTGMGKTTLLENMVISDIVRGEGIALIDPHGDLVERVIDFIPNHRINDVLYFSPSDTDYPIGFNLFDAGDVKHRYLISSAIISIFKKIWADSWGPRLEYILRNSLLALLESPGNTLLGIPRLFVDKDYRNKVVNQIQDPVVKSFWVKEYARYQDKFLVGAVSPIQNKIGQFTSIATIRNIIGQTKSRIDFREAMDMKKILLFNLSKGLIGEDVSSLLGAMILSKLQIAAMSRADIPEEARTDFFTYIDEFQNFSTDSFANILSEARKYKLSLIMAHQYVGQLSEEVQKAIFGNVGTSICFRVGAEDAEFLRPEFEPEFLVADLVALGQFEIAIKLMVDSVTSRPFSARTLPPMELPNVGVREKVLRVSRERYAVPREIIEQKLNKWLA